MNEPAASVKAEMPMDEGPNAAAEKKQRLSMMALSVSVSALLMVLKFYSYWLTGSSAILSDALESIINVVASGFALWSVLLASKPPDVATLMDTEQSSSSRWASKGR